VYRRDQSSSHEEETNETSSGEMSLVDEAKLPGIYSLPHCDGMLTSHLVVPEDEGAVVMGVPKPKREWIRSVGIKASPSMMVLTERCEDGEAQLKWVKAFSSMQRVVHRRDAGRGAYRRDDKDLLLSAGNDLLGRARTQMTADDIGRERTRRVDDGPWRISPSFSARWSPGYSLGSIVVRYAAHGGVLFTGRTCGFDPRGGDLSAFPLETDHSVQALVDSLRSLADAPAEWDFEWIIPARGEAIHFRDARDARQALRDAAERTKAFVGKDIRPQKPTTAAPPPDK